MQQKLSPGVQRCVDKANELGAKRAEFRAGVRKLKFDTIAVHGIYSVEEAFAGGQGGSSSRSSPPPRRPTATATRWRPGSAT